MRLNVSTYYGMQIILHLAQNEKRISSAELSESLYISKRYVSQIAQKLREGNLITTHAGMNGGYMLNKVASSISIYDLLTLLEDGIEIPDIQSADDDLLHTTLSVSTEYLIALYKKVTFDQLAGFENSGRFHKIKTLIESHIEAIVNQ